MRRQYKLTWLLGSCRLHCLSVSSNLNRQGLQERLRRMSQDISVQDISQRRRDGLKQGRCYPFHRYNGFPHVACQRASPTITSSTFEIRWTMASARTHTAKSPCYTQGAISIWCEQNRPLTELEQNHLRLWLIWPDTHLSVWKGIAQDALVMNIDDLLCVGATDNILVSSTIGRNKNLIPGEVISAIINGTEELPCNTA